MTAERNRVVVVGAGVVGLACAHYLRQAGCAVTVLDRGAVGQGCSHANCGYVCPSHVLPFAGPGVIGKTLATLLQKDSPLTIRFRLDPALWSWMVRFALCCNRHRMLDAGHAIAALLNSSRQLYAELVGSGGIEAEWQEKGLLFVYRTPAEMEHYAHTNRLLAETFAMPAQRYDGDAVSDLEPALVRGLAGGWHYPGDAHLRPDVLMTSWHAELTRQGVTFHEQRALVGLETAGRRVTGVVTPQGTVAADAVVVATGAWTPQLAKHLRCTVPIQPGKGYSITMARPSRCPAIPIIFEEDRVAVTPFAGGYRLGSTMEFGGYDETLNRGRLEILRRAARQYLHEPEAEPVTEEWWGWRPMVPDGKPIIGRPPRFDNLVVAAGHGMLGLSMAPGTGKLAAELLTGATPHVDPSPYAVTRF
ncbi:MAG: FAD-dependent oxidoreductase [Gemmataceae bacterium]